MHIVIGDEQAAQERIGGDVDTRDVRGAMRSLERQAPIRFREDDRTITLEYRAPTNGAKH